MDELSSDLSQKEIIPRSKSYKKSQPRYLLSSMLDSKPSTFSSKSNPDNNPERENSNEKQQLADQLKCQSKEINFLHTLLNQFMDPSYLPRIKEKSELDLETNYWTLPSFFVQQRKPVFPNMQKSQFKELISKDLRKKKVVIKDEAEGKKVSEPRPVSSFAARRSKKVQGKYCL